MAAALDQLTPFQRLEQAREAGHADEGQLRQLHGTQAPVGHPHDAQHAPLLLGQSVRTQRGTKAHHDRLAGLEQSHGQ